MSVWECRAGMSYNWKGVATCFLLILLKYDQLPTLTGERMVDGKENVSIGAVHTALTEDARRIVTASVAFSVAAQNVILAAVRVIVAVAYYVRHTHNSVTIRQTITNILNV